MSNARNFLKVKRSTKNYNKICSKISVNILKQRNSLGKTQKEFAEYMGVTQGMVSKWESGEYNFTISSIANILDKLNLNFNFDIIPNKPEEDKIVKFDFNFNVPVKKENLFTSNIKELSEVG